ncbi:MAG: hypothetical protein A2X86_13955 [Bdellovibrionales bacterium GWA2_49_15]|nr:MAG: hypothetical protein A2X86_13955 [Bdellovibrionales bacterium GWA2_49_15]HAZ13633.1 hypothetical protein [Bdellovibrionales bacterium]
MRIKKKILLFLLEIFYRAKGFEFAFYLRNFFEKRVMILMFHRVCDGSAVGLPTISISKKNYLEFIKLLCKFFKAFSPEDLLQAHKSGKTLPANAIMLTFDDAYEDAYQHGVKFLVERAIPATVFPVTMALREQAIYWWDVVYGILRYTNLEMPIWSDLKPYLNGELQMRFHNIFIIPQQHRTAEILRLIEHIKHLNMNLINEITEHLYESYNCHLRKIHGPIARSMSLEALRELESKGCTVGSHTVTHNFLDKIPPAAVKAELFESKAQLQEITGKVITAFAYPAGLYNLEVIKQVQECGYVLGFTTKEGTNYGQQNYLELSRINIWDGFVCNDTGRFSPSLALWRLFIS